VCDATSDGGARRRTEGCGRGCSGRSAAVEYAVERELPPLNPLTALKMRKSRTVETVDKRVVVSPDQAVGLLARACARHQLMGVSQGERVGTVNLVELAAAETIDWVTQGVEGTGAGEYRCAVMQGVLVSGGDHQPLRLAVLPVPAQSPRRRGDDDRAWDCGLPRNHPPVVRKVRPDLRQRAAPTPARPGDKWHLDEVFITINGQRRYLWRAVDQHGAVLDILVTSRRNAKAATRFFRKLLKGLHYVPRVLITDKLASYPVAHRRLMRSVEHRRSKYLNNRAENSHQPRCRSGPTMGRSTRAAALTSSD
jgi:hypothetical protein